MRGKNPTVWVPDRMGRGWGRIAILDVMNTDDSFQMFCCKRKRRNRPVAGSEIRVKRGCFYLMGKIITCMPVGIQ